MVCFTIRHLLNTMRIYTIGKYRNESHGVIERMEVTLAEIKYEIIETIAVLSESPKGWKKELNLISWNGREPKYDIREWSPEHEKMGKGVTLSDEELKKLKDALNTIDK